MGRTNGHGYDDVDSEERISSIVTSVCGLSTAVDRLTTDVSEMRGEVAPASDVLRLVKSTKWIGVVFGPALIAGAIWIAQFALTTSHDQEELRRAVQEAARDRETNAEAMSGIRSDVRALTVEIRESRAAEQERVDEIRARLGRLEQKPRGR